MASVESLSCWAEGDSRRGLRVGFDEMEERSRRRVRDLVTQLAFRAYPRMRSDARGYPWWPGAICSTKGRIQMSKTNYSTEQIQLATHGRSIQLGQSRRFESAPVRSPLPR